MIDNKMSIFIIILKSKKMEKINQIVIKGTTYDIEDKNSKESVSLEKIRATKAEEELNKQIKGISNNTNPLTDPFKFLGSFSSMDNAIIELDKLHSTSSTSQKEGIWRFDVGRKICEVKCIPIHYSTDRWMQVLESPFRYNTEQNTFDLTKNLRYRTIYRLCENGTWHIWQDTEEKIENELNLRLQGNSINSNAALDPFKLLGTFTNPNDATLVNALNNLHSTNRNDGYEGVWRINVLNKPSILYNFAMDYTQDKWIQSMITVYSPHTSPNYMFGINNKINILYRTFNIEKNQEWSKWRNITQDNADAIKKEETRAMIAEQSLLSAIPSKNNYLYIDNNNVYITSKYNNNYDIVIQFGYTLTNNIYSIRNVSLVPNSGSELSTNSKDKTGTTLCQQISSDMIGPLSVNTVLDDGTVQNTWVGGNHLWINQDSGIKTEKTNSYFIYADDKQITNQSSIYADKITIKINNTIFDPNIPPSEGENILSSPLIEENVIFNINKGEIVVNVEHLYKKDIYVSTYYGMQSMFTQGQKFITAQGGYSNWETIESLSLEKNNAPSFNRFSQKDTNGFYQNTILLPYGLGTHELITKFIFKVSGRKAYHVLIEKQNITSNTRLFWCGVYNWVQPIIDDENNYCYSYTIDTQHNISLTAKKAYNSCFIPFPIQYNNKIWKVTENSEKILCNNFISSHLLSSSTTQGSIMGYCDSLLSN